MMVKIWSSRLDILSLSSIGHPSGNIAGYMNVKPGSQMVLEV